MKTTINLLAVALAVWGVTGQVRAAVSVNFLSSGPTSYSAAWSGTAALPDNSPSGVAFNLNFGQSAPNITGMTVSFNIIGGYNGDMYAYLSHGDGFVVLLNRVGRGTANPDGSPGSGFDITFSSNESSDPTYIYNVAGTHGQQTVGNLGQYAVDGRNISPTASVGTFDIAARDATFSSLNLANPNGAWTLFFADVSAGGPTATLNSFNVTVLVPEPVTWALIGFGTVFGVVQLVRFYRRRFVATP